MARPIIYGPSISHRVHSVRLALEEKQVAYDLVDMAPGARQQPPHLARQPFGKVPAFEHDGFALYETQAILRYVDEVFAGDSLQPTDARQRARMNQIIGIVDDYGFKGLTVGILLQRMVKPRYLGLPPDEAVIAAAIPLARLCFKEFERLMGDGPFLVSDRVSLADLVLAPITFYIGLLPESVLLEPHARLRAWSQRMAGRASMLRTVPPWAKELAPRA